MKLSDIMGFAETITNSVSELVGSLDAKFAKLISKATEEIEEVKEKQSALATKEEVDAVRSSINRITEDVSSEIETRFKSVSLEPAPAIQIKSAVYDGGSIKFGMSDGAEIEVEIPVIEGQRGEDGANGKDGGDGKDGRDGQDGKDGIDGENGKDGQDGKDGRDGENGKDGVSLSVEADTKSLTFSYSDGREYVVEIPQPEAPALPRDPIDIASATIDRNDSLVLVLSNGKTIDLGRVVGRDGYNGRDGVDGQDGAQGITGERGLDGRDGFGFDDMTVDLMDDGRTVNFMFSRGSEIRSFPIKFPVSIFRGGYNAERLYEEGDAVQFAGTTYSATKQVIGVAPGGHDSPWVVMTSAGRTVRGPRGEPGRDGRNGISAKPLF